MKKVLETKVSKVEIVDYLKGKSSKKDLEVVMRQIHILHKQLKQLVVLLTQKFRGSIESETQQSPHAKMNKKVNLLHQVLLIGNWINSFDSQSVNDAFDNSQNRIPEQLMHYQ